MQPWFIPMFYVSGAVLGGLALPRIEQAYLSSYTLGVSVASAQALLSAAASGMMALTGIVFAMAFVMVQFSAIAYSPRLVLWFARDRTLFHALGAFTATFIYALFTLAWVDRGGFGKGPAILDAARRDHDHCQHAPVFKVDAAPWRPSDRQRASPARRPGARRHRRDVPPPGRCVRRPSSLPKSAASTARLGRVTQTVKYFGKPRTVAKLDVDSLVALAREATRDDRDGVRGRRYAGRGFGVSCMFTTRERRCRRTR